MAQTQVIKAIIRRGPQFLLGLRAPHKASAPGFWSPIAGRIEPGETAHDAVIRECQEELGINVEPLKQVLVLDVDGGEARMHWWTVRISEGSPEPHLNNDEHTELRWFTVHELEAQFAKERNLFREDIEILIQCATATEGS